MFGHHMHTLRQNYIGVKFNRRQPLQRVQTLTSTCQGAQGHVTVHLVIIFQPQAQHLYLQQTSENFDFLNRK